MKNNKSSKGAEFKAAVIKTLKSLIVPVSFLLLIGVVIYLIMNWEGVEVEEETVRPYGFSGIEETLVLENDRFVFEMDPATTHFTVTMKDSGKVWYSNPVDASSDPVALSNDKNRLQSTMILTHSTKEAADLVYDNYAYSIENQVYDIVATENEIKVIYSIGNIDREFILPLVMSAERLAEYKETWEKNDYMMLTDYYKKYDINKLGKKDNKEELLERYPMLADTVIYALRDTVNKAIRTKLEQVFESYGYTYEMYLEDKKNDTSGAATDKPVFNIPMVYRLDGDDLIVEVPYDEMEFLEEHPVYNLSILPYFGAGGKSDEGYLMVPEGGGAIINFNNGKITQNTYYANVYGWDMCLDREYVVNETRTAFGVFGSAVGEDSFLCILEDSKSYSAIQADVSGKTNSYNYVNAVYTIMNREKFELGQLRQSNLYKYVDTPPEGEKICQRYCFIDSNSYADMAREYRDYLMKKYDGYFTAQEETEVPVMVEILGAADKVKQVFGIPMSRPLALTTFAEAEAMVTDLYNSGLKNMSVKLSGWANGGIEQKVANSVNPVGALGSKKELQSLSDTAASNGIELYLNGITSYAYNSNILDGFNVFSDAARFISRKKAEMYRYDTITFEKSRWQESFYLLSAEEILKMADNLSLAAQQYGAGISFEDLGRDLSSDFNNKNLYTREDVLAEHTEKLKELSDSGMNVMLNAGNDYAVAYSDFITNMRLSGKEYGIIDYTIPFYQIVLHGYKNYVGESINIAQNYKDELLKSVEYGAGLSFTLMDESSFSLQDTFYTHYFGAEYGYWRDRLVEEYTRYNTELGHVFNQEILNHEYVAESCTCTTYEDGTKVFVNYDYSDLVLDGVTIPAKDYAVVR